MDTTTSDLPVPWEDLSLALRVDGSLRDVIVLTDTDRDWQEALDYARRLVTAGRARIESEPAALPESVTEIFELRVTGDAWMHLFIGPLQINCFFATIHVEFVIDPREAATPAGATTLVEFIEGLGHAVGAPTSLTEESMPKWDWLTFDPATLSWRREKMFDRAVARDTRRR